MTATPLERVALTTSAGFIVGCLAAVIWPESWLAILVWGFVCAFGFAAAMVVKLAMEAAQRRRLRSIVPEPRVSHINQIQRDGVA